MEEEMEGISETGTEPEEPTTVFPGVEGAEETDVIKELDEAIKGVGVPEKTRETPVKSPIRDKPKKEPKKKAPKEKKKEEIKEEVKPEVEETPTDINLEAKETSMTFADITPFMECLKGIGTLMNEVLFDIKKGGLEIIGMDPANVAMVIFKMSPEECVKYSLAKEDKFMLNLTNLLAVLKRTKKDDVVTLSFTDAEVKIGMVGKAKREFTVPMIEIEDNKKQKMPELNFKTHVTLSIKEFKEGIDDVKVVADSVLMTAKGSEFIFFGEGDLTKGHVDFETAEIKSEEVSVSKYSIEYLEKIAKTKLGDKVIINFGKDYPSLYEYKNLSNTLSLKYVLAPRVDQD